jgi:hypothetical protein
VSTGFLSSNAADRVLKTTMARTSSPAFAYYTATPISPAMTPARRHGCFLPGRTPLPDVEQ